MPFWKKPLKDFTPWDLIKLLVVITLFAGLIVLLPYLVIFLM